MVLAIIFGLSTMIFSALAVYFSWRFEKKSEEMARSQGETKRKFYELSLLSQITEKIGYSLNVESVAETIAQTAENLFDVSTVSYAIIEPDARIRLKTFNKEPVGAPYKQELSKIVSTVLSSIDSNLTNYRIDEAPQDYTLSDTNTHFDIASSQTTVESLPKSYFNIPLVLDNKLLGLINFSSKKKMTYPDEDVTLIYKVVDSAQRAIQKLRDVIQNEEAKLDSLILSLPSGTLMFTPHRGGAGFTPNDGSFALSVINDAARGFLRVSENTNTVEVMQRFGDQVNIRENIQNVFVSHQPFTIEDLKIFDRDFRVFVNPVFHSHKSTNEAEQAGKRELIGVAVIMRDITSAVKLEKVKADFTDMMVHELRAPLTAIRGTASLLVSGTLSPQDAQKMPRIISDSANDMLSTVADFLDFAKIDEGKFKLSKLPSDISKVISEHLEVFTYAAREKNITISYHSNVSIPKFLFDPIRIGQVINNFISNSIKFTDEGGAINVKIDQKGAEICVSVADNGQGIPENKKPLLFTKFGQINESIGPGKSSGLGLYISHEIIVAHGGKIWIESKEGEGTTAYFSLPFLTDDTASESDKASSAANLSN